MRIGWAWRQLYATPSHRLMSLTGVSLGRPLSQQALPPFRPAGSGLHATRRLVNRAILLVGRLGRRWIDPHGFGQLGRLGRFAHEALGMHVVGDVQHVLAGLDPLRPPAIMDIFRRQPTQC